MYALHQTVETDGQELSDLDEDWIRELPDNIPLAGACEIPYVWIRSQDGNYQDTFCQLTVPWLIIGTVNIYSKSAWKDRLRINCWLEKLLSDGQIFRSDAVIESWKRSEITIALRFLLGDL